MTDPTHDVTTHRTRRPESSDAQYEHTSADVAPELFDGFTESR